MTDEYHSIWLMPCSEQEKDLAAIVQDLAGFFDSPIFQPHLTLVEDMPRSREELKPLVDQLVEDTSCFDVSVETVEESPLYYRSFYIRFPVTEPLRILKERAVGLFGVGSLDTFMPHISIAYGVAESADKTEAVAALRNKLQGIGVKFDKVCIVSSSQKTPIEQWKIRYEISLTR